MLDPDVGIREDEIERMVLRAMEKYRPMNVTHSHSNGNGFNKWLVGVVAGLVIVGIPALIAAQIFNYARISVLEYKVDLALAHAAQPK